MYKLLLSFAAWLLASICLANDISISSPDGRLNVAISNLGGRATYSMTYDGKPFLLPSALGLESDMGDFTSSLTLVQSRTSAVDKNYTMTGTKTSAAHFVANLVEADFTNAGGDTLRVTFLVADNDVAFRYSLLRRADDDPKCAVIYGEATSFNFPDGTTTFICPQSKPMVGWKRTTPSYEEEYKADAPLGEPSEYGEGFTFPCLFHLHHGAGGDGWALVSETGVGSNYAGSHLADYETGKGYAIAYPNPGEMNGLGSACAAITVPGSTPWRTITLGASLKPIVETTIPYDVVEQLYEPSQDYKGGRYVWSWLVWQDNSINYDDQVQFVDLAATMGYEYVLVDNFWDTQIGRDKIGQLAEYARGKGVRLMMWYNSNGYWNDAQGPRDCMNTSYVRQREMAWLKSLGVAGIKVDFFGSDKQEMMKLYEDILVDANNYGLQVIFHGCTIPRGWERMYPNYVASEALLASENVYFDRHHAEQEGFELTIHPFCRNALGTVDWGGIIMNRHLSRDNKSRHRRFTTDVFELATGIVLQTSVNCVAIYPNNLDELPQFELDFLKALPTTWDEVQFIDGYPSKYVVLARRTGDKWYVAGLNGTNESLTLSLSLPMLAGKAVSYYTDNGEEAGKSPRKTALKIGADGTAQVTMQPLGGVILVE